MVWQNGFDPKKKAQHLAAKPKLYTPDFMKKLTDESIKKDTVSLDVDEVKDLLSKPRI